MKTVKTPDFLKILVADDDIDDRYFFRKALEGIEIPTKLITVEDGEMLLTHLSKNINDLPDVLFLDLNMPRKNGSECLNAIKSNEKLSGIPVIIYSTSLHHDIADLLFDAGAQFYFRKTELNELRQMLRRVLPIIASGHLEPSTRDEFVLSLTAIDGHH
jgi:CheY-like chemotaxis protein